MIQIQRSWIIYPKFVPVPGTVPGTMPGTALQF